MIFGEAVVLLLATLQVTGGVVRQENLHQRPRLVIGGVTLEADVIDWTSEPPVRRFSGNVVATYEVTKMTAEEAEVNEETRTVTFRKGVRLTDPVGEASADRIVMEFDEHPEGGGRERWIMKRAVATGITLHAHEARLGAEEIEILPNVWKMKNAWATLCPGRKPDFSFWFKEIVLRPGKSIESKKTRVYLGDFFSSDLPAFRVGLDPSQTGIQMPTPVFSEGFKLGYRWRNVFAIGNQASFIYEQNSRSFDHVPSINTQVAFNSRPRPENELDTMISIYNPDSERFYDGYFDHIGVPNLQQEEKVIGREEVAFFAGRTTNFFTVARPGASPVLDRDWYFGIDASGRWGGFPIQGQVRYGEVHPRLSDERNKRVEAYATVLSPKVELGSRLKFGIRADFAGYWGEGNHYAWVRPLAGFTYRWNKQVQTSVGYFSAWDTGKALFDADRLYSTDGLHLRFDFDFPATDFSVLLKYDFDRKSWYDVEFTLGQVAHCIRPFVIYRKFPGLLTFGFQIRAEKLFESLRRRRPIRESGGT